RVDCIGNELTIDWAEIREKKVNTPFGAMDDFGRPYKSAFSQMGQARQLYAEWESIGKAPNRLPEYSPRLAGIRNHSPPTPVASPCDEPMLGLIGLWQKHGPDPHLALAIGGTMLRVGQRRIAWSAYERAKRLADGFGPTPEIHQALRDHCNR